MNTHKNTSGYTLVELLVVLVIMAILAALVYSMIIPRYRERAFLTRSIAELNAMGNAARLYVAKYNDYPPDVVRDVPAGLKEFVQGQYATNAWPTAPWPGSVYDWDNWPPDGNGPEQTYQISIRFCNAGDTPTCKRNFPKEDWVTSDWDSYSSVYYCIKGSCRSHQNFPMNHPGYCINCGNKAQVF